MVTRQGFDQLEEKRCGSFEVVSLNVLFVPAPVSSSLKMSIRYPRNVPPSNSVLTALIERPEGCVHVCMCVGLTFNRAHF